MKINLTVTGLIMCPRCESNDISTNGTAGWFCYSCGHFFDEPWYPSEYSDEDLNNAEKFILKM